MIRFLNVGEINHLRRNYNHLLALKIVSKDHNLKKFNSMSLTLDQAIKSYVHLLNLAFFNNMDTTAIDNTMRKYFEQDKDITIFLNTCEQWCNLYDEDSLYFDDLYDQYLEIVSDIYSFFIDYLGKYYAMDLKDNYELIYDYNSESMNEEEMKLWFNHRKELIEMCGGFIKARYWIPEYLQNAPTEDILPDEDTLFDALRTESTSIAIAGIKKKSFNNYLVRTFNRTIGARGDGGLYSDCYYEDNNFFLEITCEDCISLQMCNFITIAINLYYLRKDAEFYEKNSNRTN